MLITTSFYNAKGLNGEFYSICRGGPAGHTYTSVKWLFPNEDNMKSLKENSISWDEFKNSYEKILQQNNAKLNNMKRMITEQKRNIILVCTCLQEASCHRSIIAEYMINHLGLPEKLVVIK